MKKSFTLILAVIILIITVVFTLQNNIQIQLNLLFWEIEASLSLVLFSTLSIGILLAIGFLTPSIITLKRKWKEAEKSKKFNEEAKVQAKKPEVETKEKVAAPEKE